MIEESSTLPAPGTPERREYQRLATERTRSKQRSRQYAKWASTIETQEEFWAANTAKEDPAKIDAWQKLQEEVLDKLYWMEHGEEVPVSDGDHVSLAEGCVDLAEFIKAHGLVALGSFYRNNKDLKAGVWSTRYWQTAETFESLCSESYATEVYAKYGFVVGIPDWVFYRFIQKHRPKTGGCLTDQIYSKETQPLAGLGPWWL